MSFYAIAHTYSGNIRRGDNRRMGLIVEFPTEGERDAWCDAGPFTKTEHRYREALAGDDADVAHQRREGGIVTFDSLCSDPYFEDWR